MLKKLVVILAFLSLFSHAENISNVSLNQAVQQVDIIDVNSADVKTLAKLKGVGETKAKAIVSYREANGNFKSLDELLKVKGIGEKVLLDNKLNISI